MGIVPTMADAVFWDNSLWFPAREFNAVCRYDLKDNIINWVSCFPGEDASLRIGHRRCFFVDRKIYFIPFHTKQISIYDMKNGSFETIPFQELVTDACQIGSKIYIFCLIQKHRLYELNTLTKEIRRIEEFTLQLEGIPEIKKGYYFMRCYGEGNHIWFGITGTKLACCWDVTLKKLDVINTGVEDIFCARCFDGDLWVVDKSTSRIFCLEEFKSLRIYEIELKNYNTESPRFRCFNNIFEYDGNLIFVPGFSDTIVVWNKREINQITLPVIEDSLDHPMCIGAVETNEMLLVLPVTSKSLIRIRKDGIVELSSHIKMSGDFWEELASDVFAAKSIAQESKYITLGGMLGYINQMT